MDQILEHFNNLQPFNEAVRSMLQELAGHFGHQWEVKTPVTSQPASQPSSHPPPPSKPPQLPQPPQPLHNTRNTSKRMRQNPWV